MLILRPADKSGWRWEDAGLYIIMQSTEHGITVVWTDEWLCDFTSRKCKSVFSPSEMQQLTPLCYSRMSPIACFSQLVKPEGSKWICNILGYILRHAVRVQGLETSGLTTLWAKVCNVGWNLDLFFFSFSVCVSVYEPVWMTLFLGQNKSTEVKTKLMFLKCPETCVSLTFPVCSKRSYSPCHH